MPDLSPAEQRSLVAAAPVARLATLRPDGTPRLVPITFALLDGLVCSAVDAVKPKRSTQLARLADVRRDPRAAVLIDYYADDWARLWWVRVDGTAAVHDDDAFAERARGALCTKYPGYATPPEGAVLVLTPTAWKGWRGS